MMEKQGIIAEGPLIMQQHHRQCHKTTRRHAFHGHGGPVWCVAMDNVAVDEVNYCTNVALVIPFLLIEYLLCLNRAELTAWVGVYSQAAMIGP